MPCPPISNTPDDAALTRKPDSPPSVNPPADTAYVDEPTSTTVAFWTQIDLPHPGSYYFPAAGGLGFGMPVTVGVAIAMDERCVVGKLVTVCELRITAPWSAATYGASDVIIMPNRTYGALRWLALAACSTCPTRLALTSRALTLCADPAPRGARHSSSWTPRSPPSRNCQDLWIGVSRDLPITS